MLQSGMMEYHQDPDIGMIASANFEDVKEKTWLATAALWVKWIHVGYCEAAGGCEVLQVAPHKVWDIVPRKTMLATVARAYAQALRRDWLCRNLRCAPTPA